MFPGLDVYDTLAFADGLLLKYISVAVFNGREIDCTCKGDLVDGSIVFNIIITDCFSL